MNFKKIESTKIWDIYENKEMISKYFGNLYQSKKTKVPNQSQERKESRTTQPTKVKKK